MQSDCYLVRLPVIMIISNSDNFFDDNMSCGEL